MNLWDAEPGKSYEIVDLDAGFFTNRTLEDLGLEPNKKVKKLKTPYFEKVVRIKMNGDTTVLGDDEAEGVIVRDLD